MSPVAQIAQIARMEVRRAFFSRRALWVYLLALFPAVLFLAHGLSVEFKIARWGEKGVTPAAVLDRMAKGQTSEEIAALGAAPVSEDRWTRRHRDRGQESTTSFRRTVYFDGSRELHLILENGVVTHVRSGSLRTFEQDRRVYAGMFQYFYLRLAVFFGCLGIFLNLFRGEMLDKSLHFWFLAPVRRDVLLLGKYGAGLVASAAIFCTGAVLSFGALVIFQDAIERQAYLQTSGWYDGFWYAMAALLGCVGYGSVFLAAGVLLRNPIIPAVVMLLWEGINGFLPDLLQKLSVLHYLQSVCPVPAPIQGDFPALLRVLLAPAAPSPAWVAIGGLVTLTALVLWAASKAVRRLEVNYGTE